MKIKAAPLFPEPPKTLPELLERRGVPIHAHDGVREALASLKRVRRREAIDAAVFRLVEALTGVDLVIQLHDTLVPVVPEEVKRRHRRPARATTMAGQLAGYREYRRR